MTDVLVPRSTRVARLARPVAAGVGVGAAVVVLALVDPSRASLYPPCPVRALLGVDCPGCGGLRCVHALAGGDLGRAADQNLLAVFVLPLVALAWVRWLRRAWQGRPRPSPLPPRAVWAFVVVLAVFTVVRNLPGVGFLPSGLG